MITKTDKHVLVISIRNGIAEYNKLGQFSNVVEQLLHNIGVAFTPVSQRQYWSYIGFILISQRNGFCIGFTRLSRVNRNHICVVIIVHRRLCRPRSTTLYSRTRMGIQYVSRRPVIKEEGTGAVLFFSFFFFQGEKAAIEPRCKWESETARARARASS